MKAKRFALLSFGVLCLALSALIGFHIGGSTAEAQAPGAIAGTFSDAGNTYQFIILDNGDFYSRQIVDSPHWTYDFFNAPAGPTYGGNFWGSGPVSTSNSTMGAVKSLYGE